MIDRESNPGVKYAKKNSVLAVDACPEILEWWDTAKNESVDIYTITAGSKQEVYLKCPQCGDMMYKAMYRFLTKREDGSYQAPICRKCTPIVRKRKISLLDAVPDIEEYWDHELNEGRNPSDLSAVASDKVWTKCPACGTLVRRNVRFTWAVGEDGIGHVIHCRTCGKRNQSNALTILFPEIKDYWCFEKNAHPPEYYTISSGKKVYVRCPDCGREKFLAVCEAICQDENGKYRISSCGECAKEKTLYLRRQDDNNNIAKACPDINLYWDDKNEWKPNELTIHTNIQIYTHCPTCNRLLHRRATNTFKNVDGVWRVLQCQKCAILETGRERALSSRDPVLLECPEIKDWWDFEKNDITPNELTRGSHYEAYLKCPACKVDFKRDVHSFIATHRNGQLLPVPCPECGFSSKGNPEDNLVEVCPEIVDWWDYEANAPFVPEQFTKGAQYMAHLKCPDCGLELYTGIRSLLHTDGDGNVVISHTGRCRKYKAMESPNNLVACYPQIKRWWNYDKNAPDLPEEYTLFSPKRAYFKCPDCGAESCRRITDAFNPNDEGVPILFKCPFCAGTKPIPHVNSLAALYPELAAECVSVADTESVFPTSVSRVEWKCSVCGEKWFGIVADRVNGQNCPYCEGKRPLPGINTVQVKHPDLIREEWAHPENMFLGIDPDNIVDTNTEKAWWKCPTCKHLYLMSVRDRLHKKKRKHNPCTFCGGRRIPSPRIIL